MLAFMCTGLRAVRGPCEHLSGDADFLTVLGGSRFADNTQLQKLEGEQAAAQERHAAAQAAKAKLAEKVEAQEAEVDKAKAELAEHESNANALREGEKAHTAAVAALKRDIELQARSSGTCPPTLTRFSAGCSCSIGLMCCFTRNHACSRLTRQACAINAPIPIPRATNSFHVMQKRVMAKCVVAGKGVARDAMLTNVDLKQVAGGSAGENDAATGSKRKRGRTRQSGGGGEFDGNDESDHDRDQDRGDADGDVSMDGADKDVADNDNDGDDAESDDESDGGAVPAELRGAYGDLPRDLQRARAEASRAAKDKEQLERISAAAAVLEQVVPNNKAPEEYEAVREELAEMKKVRD